MQCPAYFGKLRGFHELAMMHGINARDVMVAIWACLTEILRDADAVTESPPQECRAITGPNQETRAGVQLSSLGSSF